MSSDSQTDSPRPEDDLPLTLLCNGILRSIVQASNFNGDPKTRTRALSTLMQHSPQDISNTMAYAIAVARNSDTMSLAGWQSLQMLLRLLYDSSFLGRKQATEFLQQGRDSYVQHPLVNELVHGAKLPDHEPLGILINKAALQAAGFHGHAKSSTSSSTISRHDAKSSGNP
jgi:hypothetical protein